MRQNVSTPDEYVAGLSEDRSETFRGIRDVINANLPDGFEERICYGYLGWVVPHSTYPPGYHCDPKMPLMFLGLASQKNFIALYHMGIYCDPLLSAWFQSAWREATPRKLDMGKSCIRLGKSAEIPIDLIGRLAAKVTPAEWIQTYEKGVTPLGLPPASPHYNQQAIPVSPAVF